VQARHHLANTNRATYMPQNFASRLVVALNIELHQGYLHPLIHAGFCMIHVIMFILLFYPMSWFMTSIKSRGAHESGERWKHEGHEGFRQVRASVRIITLRPVF
jgi:hypothetical protein